jgi:hypothetical protein
MKVRDKSDAHPNTDTLVFVFCNDDDRNTRTEKSKYLQFYLSNIDGVDGCVCYIHQPFTPTPLPYFTGQLQDILSLRTTNTSSR